jgi:hypothetical protein
VRAVGWLIGATLSASVARAQDPETADAADVLDDPAVTQGTGDEDLVVRIYDGFARWDGTRWMVSTEVIVPWVEVFLARQNYSFRSRQYQVRTILACEKDWRRSNRRWEIDCTVEDFGLQVVAHDQDDPSRVQSILDEYDRALSGSYVELQVADDGRVTNIDLEGLRQGNDREQAISETLRQVMSRVIVGYEMKLRRHNDLTEGVWVEYNSKLLAMPARGSISGYTREAATRGTSTLVHKLARREGHLVVESRGRGISATDTDQFQMEYSGVAVYDERDGFMTERVWALSGAPTAGGASTASGAGFAYHHVGRLMMLGEADHPDVGPTRQVSAPGIEHPILPPWRPLEET